MIFKFSLQEKYSDGTIFCDGIIYPVHSFVLATCSKYFEEIFEKCPKGNSKQPFIVIRDISRIQVEAILSYMYKGEVVVPQKTLPDLIKAAELLKVKGLGIRENQPKIKTHKENLSLGNEKKRDRSQSPCSEATSSKKLKDEPMIENNANGSSDDNSGLDEAKPEQYAISHSLFTNLMKSIVSFVLHFSILSL